MNPLSLPWLELSLALCAIGSLWVSQVRDPDRSYQWGMAFSGLSFLCAVLAWLGFYLAAPPGSRSSLSPQFALLGRPIFELDELGAPLVPAIALIHFLTAMATSRSRMRRFSGSWSLASECLRLMLFSCAEPWLIIGLLAVATIPPYIELASHGRPTRVFLIHMALFVALLVIGWSAVEAGGVGRPPSAWATIPLLLAILIRCGTVPAHCWVTDWFEHSTFGSAILFATPLGGVYAAVRLLLPIAPDWVLHSIALCSLVTAVYAAGMATIQREVRRFYAQIFISLASLVLVGLELNTVMSLTGSLCLWFSVILSLTGFGLTLRAIESRFGRLSLASFHGLYEHSPTLAVCFLLTGLACVGFPGTLGFISTEILVDSAVVANPMIGMIVITAAALNGIAVVRAYLYLFTGARHVSTVSLVISTRERVAVLTLAAMILGGGFFPQPGVTTRELAARAIVQERANKQKQPVADSKEAAARSLDRRRLSSLDFGPPSDPSRPTSR